jgi:hypothetical protein
MIVEAETPAKLLPTAVPVAARAPLLAIAVDTA